MTGPATTARSPWHATRGLGWLAGFGAFGVGLSALYSNTGYGLGCPFRAVTGWDCPLCGGTRLGAALLQGDVAAAAAFNPLLFVGLLALAALGLLWLIEAVGGPRFRPSLRLRTQLRRVSATGWLVVGGAIAVAYTLLRNLV